MQRRLFGSGAGATAASASDDAGGASSNSSTSDGAALADEAGADLESNSVEPCEARPDAAEASGEARADAAENSGEAGGGSIRRFWRSKGTCRAFEAFERVRG